MRMTYVKVFIVQLLFIHLSEGQKEGDLLLSDGSNSRRGRLEIYHNGSWGTICDDYFDALDALVACRQLIHRDVRDVSYYTAGGGTGSIWMDNLNCSGKEFNISSCSHRGWGIQNCGHSEDIGIQCNLPPNEGDLHLSGGNNSREGRLEIYHNRTWGTICDDNFGALDALVACRQLSYSNGHMRNVSFYTAGGGTSTIWMDNLACSGSEFDLFSCSHSGWGVHDCGHAEDVGIRCYENEGDLRVSRGHNSREGRLEIYHNETWGTICDDNFGTADAIVACRQLTNRNVRNATYYTAGDGTSTIWLDELACSGTEWTISNCSHAGWGVENCDHDEDVGIRCFEANDGDLRVSGGSNSREGRLEIYHNGRWGTICKDGFGTADALVVCGQLTNRNVRNASFYTVDGGTSIIWMDNLACSGSELKLIGCFDGRWGDHNCSHDKDVGIRCSDAKEGDLDLSGGNTSRDGRLEIYHNGRWGTICDDGFSTQDAIVVCRQLTNRNVSNVSFYTAAGGNSTIWMSNVVCSGREWNLNRCSHDGWGNHKCNHDEDVGIRCYDANEGDLRVSGGSNSGDGRLEIFHDGLWGTICDDDFDMADALVACRQLTNRNLLNVSYYTAGDGTGSIWMHNLACNGREWKLNSCSHSRRGIWGSNTCSHAEDVGIQCFVANEGQEECQWSTGMIGMIVGVAAGCVVGTLTLVFIGYCMCRRIRHLKHGKQQGNLCSQNMEELRGRRGRENDYRETIELPCSSTGSDIYDEVTTPVYL